MCRKLCATTPIVGIHWHQISFSAHSLLLRLDACTLSLWLESNHPAHSDMSFDCKSLAWVTWIVFLREHTLIRCQCFQRMLLSRRTKVGQMCILGSNYFSVLYNGLSCFLWHENHSLFQKVAIIRENFGYQGVSEQNCSAITRTTPAHNPQGHTTLVYRQETSSLLISRHFYTA